MTSRRGTLVEQGARELLQVNGYTVRIIPCGFNKRLPPAHLVATKTTGETRFIRIQKISHQPICVDTVEHSCANDIVQFRKYIQRHPELKMLHCEIWTYTIYHGFRPFEVTLDSVMEILKLSLIRLLTSENAGAS